MHGRVRRSQNNALNANFDIIGNAATSLAGQCNGSIAMNVVGTGWAGTFNIKFNCCRQADLLFNTQPPRLQHHRQLRPLVHSRIGWQLRRLHRRKPANITFVYRYNAWTNNINAIRQTPRQAQPGSTRLPHPPLGSTCTSPQSTACSTTSSQQRQRRLPLIDLTGVLRPQSGNCAAGAFK